MNLLVLIKSKRNINLISHLHFTLLASLVSLGGMGSVKQDVKHSLSNVVK